MSKGADPLIDLRDVSFRADGQLIVEKASWQVRRGEHWAVLGANGSGKTTLLRLACGYLWPNAGGRIFRLGEVLTDLRKLRESIGWLTATLPAAIPPRETVRDTVVSGKFAEIGLKPSGSRRPSRDDYALAEARLAELDCGHLAGRRFGVLSQGEQQMVLVARARMAEPLLLVLDEPCAGLDPGARERFLSVLERLAASHETPSLILVTHHLEEIMPAFANILVLAAGKVVQKGLTRQVITSDLIEQLYGCRVERLMENDGRTWPVLRGEG